MQWGPLNQKDVRDWLSKPSTNSNEAERKQTLVVNDVDRFYPPLADWMFDNFCSSFLPNWRLDDGQISLAEQGGGIGPHVDNYDVFLIQMSGSRKWQVGRRKLNAQEERDRTIDSLDVRVLSDWSLDGGEIEEWEVYPGDLLYLPPRVPHCGTATTGECMTLSVGCRAPSVSDLVSKLAERLSFSSSPSAVRRYSDEDLLKYVDTQKMSPGELTSDAKERARRLVLETINDDEWWDEFFGCYVTEQKRVRNNYPIPLNDCVDGAFSDDLSDNWSDDANQTVMSVLDGKNVLFQAEGIAFAYSNSVNEAARHRFFVNGKVWQTNDENMARLFQIIGNNRRIDRTMLLGLSDPSTNHEFASEAISFLSELILIGVLYSSNE